MDATPTPTPALAPALAPTLAAAAATAAVATAVGLVLEAGEGRMTMDVWQRTGKGRFSPAVVAASACVASVSG